MILWDGACMVHEIFSVGDLLALKSQLPQARSLAHPECPANVREHSDFIGGTEAMLRYGSDKPDLRYGLEIVDVGDLVPQTAFKVFQDAIAAGGRPLGA